MDSMKIENSVFIENNINFYNDRYNKNWKLELIIIKKEQVSEQMRLIQHFNRNNAIIGANSVVISDVEENTVVAGVPAKN